LTNGLSI